MQHVLTTINGGGSSGVTDASIYVRFLDLTERDYSQFDVMDDARAMMKERFPELRAAVQGVQGVSGAGFRAQAVVLNVRGPDLNELQRYSDEILQLMRETPGMIDQDTTFSIGNPEVHVHIDRAKAADFGVRAPGVATALRTMVASEETGGQLLCLLLTLLFTPVAYSLFDDLVVRVRGASPAYSDAAEPMKAD